MLELLLLCFTAATWAHPGLKISIRNTKDELPDPGLFHVDGSANERETRCFPEGTTRVKPADPEMCQQALDMLIPRDAPTRFTEPRKWFAGKDGPDDAIEVPWNGPAPHVGAQYCEIIVTGDEGALEEFSLLDIALAADAVITKCVGPSKTNLGGGAIISEVVGHGKAFTAFVNGPSKDPDGAAGKEPVLTLPPPGTETGGLDAGQWFCFDEGNPGVYSVNPDRCHEAINLMFPPERPFSFFERQKFYNGENAPEGSIQCPRDTRWPAGFFGTDDFCEIVLTANTQRAEAELKLSDVALKARFIIRECPPRSKASLGGGGYFADTGFFVVVNGKRPGADPNSPLEIPPIPAKEKIKSVNID